MGSGAQTPGRAIAGEALRAQGDMDVVNDSTGAEVSLHVPDSSIKFDKPEEGDRIEAKVTADGPRSPDQKSRGIRRLISPDPRSFTVRLLVVLKGNRLP
jgi:hypothetical protein